MEPQALRTQLTQLDAELDELLDLEGIAREERLRALEGLDAVRGQRLRAWLQAIERSEGYFESPLGRVEAAERVGPWRVLRLIGQGGMGEVYLGERADGAFSRRVAIKFLRPGRGTVKQLARERQVLARLRHPGIAQLLDGGVTESGRPYLVMEWVDGLSLDRWVGERKPGLRARVEVLRQVAQAVSYAHANLVIHRDLKPANVMVDGSGSVRLLDFGIARLLEEPAGQMLTEDRALTPELAAPEQFLGQGVSTRTDVYALGGLLYWLVSGRFAHDSKGLALADLVQRVCHEDPQAPSALAGGKADADLDAVVLTALSRDPERRYASAEALARDLERWLAGETVSARLPTAWERGLRFARRHKIAVGLTAAVFVSLVAGIAGTLWQARKAAQETHKAVQERDLALLEVARGENLIKVFARLFGQGNDAEKLSSSQWLDRAAQLVDQPTTGDRLLRARFLHRLADIEQERGLYSRSVKLYEKLLQQYQPLLTRAERARAHCRQASAYGRLNQFPRALERLLLGELLAEPLQGAARIELIDCLAVHAQIAAQRSIGTESTDSQVAIAQRALNELDQLAGYGDLRWRRSDLLYTLATALDVSGQVELALQRYDEVIALDRALGNAQTANFATVLATSAGLLRFSGHLQEAASRFAESLKVYQYTGERSARYASALIDYASLQHQLGEHAEAYTKAKLAIEVCTALGENAWLQKGSAFHLLGRVATALNDAPTAEQAFAQAEELYRKTVDGQDNKVFNLMGGRAKVALLLTRDTARARALIIPVINHYRATPNTVDYVQALLTLAEIELQEQHFEAARKVANEVSDWLRARNGPDTPSVAERSISLARVYWKLGSKDDAKALLARGLPVLRQAYGADNVQVKNLEQLQREWVNTP